jgi:catechol 2,3-dioxygenase-like lactoylglutathione lyase family enzyme
MTFACLAPRKAVRARIAKSCQKGQGGTVETLIARLLQDFEHGKLTRRQLIQSLTLAAAATSAPGIASAADGKGFKTIGLNHISYVVADFKKTRDFYTDLMGMTVAEERANECRLGFGTGILIARKGLQGMTPPLVDHISFTIADWDTDRVKAELEGRGLKPRLDTGALPTSGSFHVADPDGYDLQIEGTLRAGDSLLKSTK